MEGDLPSNPENHTRPFLSAQWSHLALVTFDVDPDALIDLLPPGVELDLIDGRAFVSLVGFDFLDTRVKGIRWPGFVNFPEVNLRFYVRYRGNRGVCFIREFVPSRMVSWIARTIYNEPYVATPMQSRVNDFPDRIEVTHTIHFSGREHSLHIIADKPAFIPGAETTEHFFKEHAWGFGRSRDGKLITYRVDHPVWAIFPNPRLTMNWDFAGIYGPRWQFLNTQAPYSLVLAKGSAVTVFPKAIPDAHSAVSSNP